MTFGALPEDQTSALLEPLDTIIKMDEEKNRRMPDLDDSFNFLLTEEPSLQTLPTPPVVSQKIVMDEEKRVTFKEDSIPKKKKKKKKQRKNVKKIKRKGSRPKLRKSGVGLDDDDSIIDMTSLLNVRREVRE